MKIITSLSFFFFSLNCFAQSKTEYAIISGKIKNSSEKIIKIFDYNHSFEKEVALDKAGKFSDTLFITSPGYYFFQSGQPYTTIFLRNGYNLVINSDADEFQKSLTIQGKGDEVNNFSHARSNLRGKLVVDAKEYMVVPLADFLPKIANTRDSLQLLLDKSGLTGEDYNIQKMIIHYDYLFTLNNYRKFYTYHKKMEPILPADYLNPVRTMNLDDSVAYHFSNDYRLLIGENWRYTQAEAFKKDSSVSMIVLTENYIKGLKSSEIKDQIVTMLFKKVSAKNVDLETDYKKIMSLVTNERVKNDLIKRYNVAKSTGGGMESSGFTYENYNGGKTNLSDFAGKYVYIDVWATWCGPCLREMPEMQKLVAEYKDKNIVFVFISVDDLKDTKKWKKMVADREFTGIHLISDNKLESAFMKSYGVSLIPRSILIGPDGKLVSATAPKASDAGSRQYLDKLFIGPQKMQAN